VPGRGGGNRQGPSWDRGTPSLSLRQERRLPVGGAQKPGQPRDTARRPRRSGLPARGRDNLRPLGSLERLCRAGQRPLPAGARSQAAAR
jgi:hypothetical protein